MYIFRIYFNLVNGSGSFGGADTSRGLHLRHSTSVLCPSSNSSLFDEDEEEDGDRVAAAAGEEGMSPGLARDGGSGDLLMRWV